MSKRSIYRCPHCERRVKRAPFIALVDRASRREGRYHGNVAGCLQVATLETQRRGPREIVLSFHHTLMCSDPAGKLDCAGRCFVVDEAA